MKKQINGKKRYNTILYVIVGLLLILWAFRIDLINTDNTFTLRLVQHPVFELIKLDALDVHPPLYYLNFKTFLYCDIYFTCFAIYSDNCRTFI